MRIECALNPKPLGVRGRGEAGFVFCPNPLARKGSRKKFADTKVSISECQTCEHYRGVHLSMNVDLVYENPFGDKEQIGAKCVVLSETDAIAHEKEKEKWLQEEEQKKAAEKKDQSE